MNFYDAHNHLQDERFAGRPPELLAAAKSVGVRGMVVNGSAENDWDAVRTLSEHDPVIIPSYGLHPWYHGERTSLWLENLRDRLRANPRAAVGEIGLDRWKEDLPYGGQEEVFLAQWRLARDLNRPASIHCLKAWGRLHQLLREEPGPDRGFILHSYGGPREMIEPLSELGAYFSFPGYYLRERKQKQRETFRSIPRERLLLETDAPDQLLPEELNRFPLFDEKGNPLNHPANLQAVYRGLAVVLDLPVEQLAAEVEQNFLRLFPSI